MAKAIEQRTTRRRLPAEQKALIQNIQRVAAEYFAAEDHDGHLEQHGSEREWQRARKATLASMDRFIALSRKMVAQPVRSWADVAVLAELAKSHQPETGKVTDKEMGEEFYTGIHSEVLCAVLDGALHMAGSSSCPGMICDDAAKHYGRRRAAA